MPTHQDFPDSYFENPDKWRRRRTMPTIAKPGPLKVAPALIVLMIAAVVVVAALRSDLLAKTSSPPSVSWAGPASQQAPQAATTTPQGTTTAFGGTLAIGTALPGTGRPPNLMAVTGHGPLESTVSIRSASPAPVSIYISNAPGEQIRAWRTLAFGQSVGQSVITGRRYGYCFAQAAADGYAATRGCGTMSVYQTLNGARLPNGAATTTLFSFDGNY